MLVITDHYTKLTQTVPMKAVSAVEGAKNFVKGWILNYGPPEELINENVCCSTS